MHGVQMWLQWWIEKLAALDWIGLGLFVCLCCVFVCFVYFEGYGTDFVCSCVDDVAPAHCISRNTLVPTVAIQLPKSENVPPHPDPLTHYSRPQHPCRSHPHPWPSCTFHSLQPAASPGASHPDSDSCLQKINGAPRHREERLRERAG